MFALIIENENRHTVLEHVALSENDSVYVTFASYFLMPNQKWENSKHLIDWVKENKPSWRVYTRTFEIAVKGDSIDQFGLG